ncbi:MAG: alpha/beta hydrolase [Propionibacteriaceae bacterium]|jgi:acetyl esterase/lipase|nr:alpha/beta hydrolase [Propionibacteriaceae bacterium]
MGLSAAIERAFGSKQQGPTIHDTEWVKGWMDTSGSLPVPRVDWIRRRYADVAYGDDPLQRLDLYLPNEAVLGRPYPLLVVIHGGGFTHMDKADWHLYPGFFALEAGFAVASINYRLAPKAKFPQPVKDVSAALQFLADHAWQYDLDVDNFFLMGTSAGGSLALLTGLGAGPGGAPSQSTRKPTIRAVAALCPATDLGAAYRWAMEHGSIPVKVGVRLMLQRYLGSTPDKHPEIAAAASPEKWLDIAVACGKPIPATYFLQGDQDPIVPWELTFACYEMFQQRSGLPADALYYETLPGAGHAGGGPDFLNPAPNRRLVRWFATHIKKGE